MARARLVPVTKEQMLAAHLRDAHRHTTNVKASLLRPTFPVYPPFGDADGPDDPVETQIAFLGSDPYYYRDGDWHPFTIAIATRDLLVVVEGGGSAITTGVKGDFSLDFDCVITGWTLLADQSGSIVLDVWKDVYANYPPTVADTITAAAKPTLSSADHATDSTLTGWTTAVTAGDTFRVNVDSASTVTRVTLALKLLG